MRLKSLEFHDFKRFTDTRIEDIPASAKLILLAGPNGSGKSSLFDGLKTWHWANGATGSSWNDNYGRKAGSLTEISWTERAKVEFHEELPGSVEDRKKLIYVRTAFRNEADFSIGSFSRMPSPINTAKISRLIDNDVSVSENYQRLIMQTIEGVYGDDIPDDMPKRQLRDRIIGHVQTALTNIYPDLQLDGVTAQAFIDGSPGTFYFTKGSAKRFLYMNLSAGEKAVFDLVLDLVIKREFFDDSIWCIDEPEAHLNTKVQAPLLRVLVDLLPDTCQLILASHSIGFMSEARKMVKEKPGSVAFINMGGVDFDQPVKLTPVAPSREFWAKTLEVALGDLATLVAPEVIVLCEGQPLAKPRDDRKAEFDASCYRKIFAEEFPYVDFMSIGGSNDVISDHLRIGRAIQTIASGTEIIRLVDRDLMTEGEVKDLEDTGVKVLTRRHIESFLYDDEVIAALCDSVGQSDKIATALSEKAAVCAASTSRGIDADDIKSSAGEIKTQLRRLLSIPNAGSSREAFGRDVLAPLIRPGMDVYRDLKACIFD